MHNIAKHIGRIWFSVDDIKGIGFTKDLCEVLVSWKGLDVSGDIQKLFDVVYEDVLLVSRSFPLSNQSTESEKKACDLIDV